MTSSSPSSRGRRTTLWLILGGCAGLLLAACALGSCGFVALMMRAPSPTPPPSPLFTPQPPTERPTERTTPQPSVLSPVPPEEASPTPLSTDDAARITWQALLAAEPAIHDRIAVYQRLTGQRVTWATPTPHPPPRPGTVRTFYVTDTDGTHAFPIQAELAYVGDHAYVWIDTRVRYVPAAVKQLGREFDTHIYPTTRAFFGSEASPGIDGDPHLYILFAQGVGSVAGYFSSSDALPPQVHPYSNAHEMFILSANMLIGGETTYAVLAHEFQHMIHHNQDPNEWTWLNEGFSELAVLLNGYDHGFFDVLYLSQPDIALLHWPDPRQESSLPYYGGGFLFVLYFLERFGEQATQALVAEAKNSVDGVQAVLNRIGARHPETGEPLQASELFLDWTIANFLNDPDLADGRFGYTRRSILRAQPTVWIYDCPTQTQEEVFPFGVDYITFTCPGTWRLEIALEPSARLWPTDPHGGDFAMWSNYGDESDMRLTRLFDLTSVSPGQPLTLAYWTWFDIEDDYDYGYVLASTDGETWTMLRPPAATDANPVGNNYGWGYTRQSNGWIHEQVDLSPYAGQRVWLRFEYLTDAAVNHWGWLIDDITIPEIGYAEDFEHGLGGWEAEGWVRAANRIPRTYQIALVLQGPNTTEVRYLPVGENFQAQADILLGDEWETATIVLMDTTRFTRLPARYRISIQTP